VAAPHPEELPMGLETEYAFNSIGPNGKGLGRDDGLRRMLALANEHFVCLRDAGAPGVFLSNGGRLYIDAGSHPEYSTPECANPRDLVRHVLGGEGILRDLVARLNTEFPGARAELLRCNVDYASKSTWGCHESFLHTGSPQAIADQIIPHLVSRLIYTGSGGFDNVSGHRSFLLSPRVAHLEQRVSSHSTESRGIFHTKDEPLCTGGFHRLHILCAESLCSQIAIFVKMSATALIVRLITAGISVGSDVSMTHPLAAMRIFASDPSCTKQVTVNSGKKLTAIEIQRTYLEAAEKHLGASFMPPWAPEACEQWSRLLDLLSRGPEAVAQTLDWAIKFALYRERAESRGVAWDKLDSNTALRDELFQIDMRWGELGEAGIFHQLDAAGVLSHAIPGGSLDVAEAMRTAPDQGRARLRGETIRRLHGESKRARSRYHCNWSNIVDEKQRRVFDLSDPFGRNASWEVR
jgi:proteasome accessory factor A